MGTVLGISKKVFDQAKAEFRTGFALPPAKANILWVVESHRVGTYDDAKTGEQREYLSLTCLMTDDDGTEYKHGQFFNLETEDDIQELKAFLLGIGRADFNPEEDDLDVLNGTKFRCDFRHYDRKNKNTGEAETRGRFEWKTLVAVNWKDGKLIDAAAAEEGLDEADEPAARPKRRGRPPKKVEPEPEEYEDEEGDEEEEEEEPKGFKSFSPRRGSRRRRAAASDKD